MLGLSGMIRKTMDHTKLSGVVGCLEGRGDIQRGWNGFGMWDIVNLMKLNKSKCKHPHLVWSNAKHGCRLDNEGVESSPEEKDLGCWWMKNWTCPAT